MTNAGRAIELHLQRLGLLPEEETVGRDPACGFTTERRQSGDCEQVAELDLPTVGQAADDYTANRSNNKNWSVGFRDNCIWQTKE
jgi:hypothetical protein